MQGHGSMVNTLIMLTINTIKESIDGLKGGYGGHGSAVIIHMSNPRVRFFQKGIIARNRDRE